MLNKFAPILKKKKEQYLINYLSLHLNELQKEQTKLKVNRKREIID